MTYQVLFCAIERHKLLIVLQFSSGTEVCEFVHRLSILPYDTHDIARLDVTVHYAILSEVIHSTHFSNKHKIQEIVMEASVCTHVSNSQI